VSSAQSHYNQLLGPVYTWMAGGWDLALARNRALLDSLGLASWPRGTAVDLGCGSGFQSIPLAEAGFDVVAIDLNETLLAELRGHAAGRAVLVVQDDLLNFTSHVDADAALIVCMGDTLPHLTSLDAVTTLVRTAAARLQPGGRLVLGFRDLASQELTGPARFIPVRSEADQIFTCFLDYDADYVEVNDLLYRREGERWHFSSSAYRKLRLSAASVGALVTDAGLTLEIAATEQGAVRIVGLKP
jgi:SAM-dependent methyltransferase